MPELNVVHVDPGGVEVDVDITRAGGASVTAYTTSAGTAPRSLPATISAVTDFWLPEAGDFTFIVSKDDVEVKRETIGVSDREDQPKTLRLTAGDLPLSALASLVGGATGTSLSVGVVGEMNNGPAAITGGSGSRTLVLDTFYSVIDAAEIAEFPDGLGLTYDDVTGVFTATEAGCWIVEAVVVFANDATAIGRASVSVQNAYNSSAEIKQPAPRDLVAFATAHRQVGETFKVQAAVSGATADPYSAFDYGTVKITRIA